MIAASVLEGIWSATVTPLDETFTPDVGRAAEFYLELLHGGCHGLNVLGTTGEAMSLGVSQRIAFMEGLFAHGIPRARTMFGTGACALADAIALTKAARELGAAAALIMPPFFYRDADDDGMLRWFDELISRAQPPPILLYNFPRMSGITFHAALVDKLIAAFPGAIAGMKDSSNDVPLQRELLARHPSLRIFTGSEEYLSDVLELGGAGCISGSVCLWPQDAAHVFRTRDAHAQERITQRRRALAGAPLIATVREHLAAARNDDAWLRAMPPL